MNDCVLILKSKPWQFTDKETGEVKTGVKVTYIDKSSVCDDEYNGFGYNAYECSIPDTESVKEVPGYYVPSFKSFIKDGNRCLKLDSVDFVQGASLWNH